MSCWAEKLIQGDLLEFASDRQPVPLSEVEDAVSICSRFVTGGMSLGALSSHLGPDGTFGSRRCGTWIRVKTCPVVGGETLECEETGAKFRAHDCWVVNGGQGLVTELWVKALNIGSSHRPGSKAVMPRPGRTVNHKFAAGPLLGPTRGG